MAQTPRLRKIEKKPNMKLEYPPCNIGGYFHIACLASLLSRSLFEFADLPATQGSENKSSGEVLMVY